MGTLTTLLNSARALKVFDQEFATIQNNIGNQNTPGYAAQNVTLAADSFNPSAQLWGGLSVGPQASTRSEYLELAVRSQTTLLGSAEQKSADLSPLQTMFDLRATSGISGSLNSFFNSFSALSVNPNDTVARQNVMIQAQSIATSFNQAASGLQTASSNVEQETNNSLGSINQIATDLAAINAHYAVTPGGVSDAGIDARVHADLENLSEVANFTVLNTNGQINVYLGGQTPLVLGQQTFKVATDFSSPQTVIRDSQGRDVTSQITGGQLGALIQENNATLPSYSSSLNVLAQAFADTVNGALAKGIDKNGNPPATNLFSYNTGADAAYTMAVTPGMTSDQIAAAASAAPGGNGNAVAVAQLATASTVNGFTFTQAFGNLGQQLGADIANANQNKSEQQNLVTQAQAQRAAVSGVNLNTEAAKLIQFQQAYQAVAKLVSTLNTITQAALNMIP